MGEGFLGNLIVVIESKADKLTAGLKAAEGRLKTYVQNADKLLETHYRKFLAVGAGITAVYAVLGKQGLDYAVRLDKMAKTADLTVEEFSRLAYAAEQEHASIESLQKSIPILTKYMEYSRMGMETYKREFDKMGISVVQANGKLKRTTDVLLEIADYASTTEDKTQALAIATTLLGRRGADILPFLSLGRKKIEELGDEAERLGLVISSETAAKLKDFQDVLDAVKNGFIGVGLEIITRFQPTLELLARLLKDGMIWFQGLDDNMKKLLITIPLAVGGFLLLIGTIGLFKVMRVGESIKAIGAGLVWLVTNPIGLVITAIALLATAWIQNWFNMQETTRMGAYAIGLFLDRLAEKTTKLMLTLRILSETSWWEKLAHPATAISEAIAQANREYEDLVASGGGMTNFGTQFAEGVQGAIDKTQELKDMLAGVTAGPGGEGMKPPLDPEEQASIADRVAGVWKDAMDNIKGSVGTVRQFFVNFIAEFHQKFSASVTSAILGVKKWSEAAKELGKSLLESIVNFFIQWLMYQILAKALTTVMAAFVSGIATALAFAWAPAAAFASLATAGANAEPAMKGMVATTALAYALAIPKAAKGGIIDRPTILLAGEAGPEAIVPLSGANANLGRSIVINGPLIGEAHISSDMDIDEVSEELGAKIGRRLKGI